MTKRKSSPRPPVTPLTNDQLELVVGGTELEPRDAASGLPTGKRTHKP